MCIRDRLSLYEFTMVTGPWSDICAEIGIKTDVSRFGAQVINGIGFLGAGTIPVSYTHLDVYKRQAEGVTEALKAAGRMEWVRRTNSIRSRVREIVNSELIYNLSLIHI